MTAAVNAQRHQICCNHQKSRLLSQFQRIGLASDNVTKLNNAWQRGKLVLDSARYKSMLAEKSLTGRSSLFLRGEVGTVLTTPSQLSASRFKRLRGSDMRGAIFWSIVRSPSMLLYGTLSEVCSEPILPVAALGRGTTNPIVFLEDDSTIERLVFDFFAPEETIYCLFTDILAGFTFNNRVLRLPALLVLLTRRFDPETRAFFGYTSKLSNRPIYTFMLLCLGVATYRAKIVLKKMLSCF